MVALYDCTKCRLRVAEGTSHESKIGIGVHQRPAVSPLFIMRKEEATKECRRGDPRGLSHVDDLVLKAETTGVAAMFKNWKQAMQMRGL